ncbi:HPP family protein [Novosphingobium sp.]|uniref:HPP family protein n=1 Tax=Novosphingobium sp. TaxID=1874826 RepID=UPI001D7C4704|nr:HPP family protein [Novosphingobium sp.]MBX9663147.1 HPP family protein [Novosphingobium sp.]
MTPRAGTVLGIFALTLLILQALVLASWIAGFALMLPSWASSTALIVGCRDVPAARPRAASLGHLVCGATGVAVFVLAGPAAHPWAPWLAAPAVAVGVTLMWLVHCYHPPAAANAAIPLFTAATMPVYAGAVALGAALLLIAAHALDRADGRAAA